MVAFCVSIGEGTFAKCCEYFYLGASDLRVTYILLTVLFNKQLTVIYNIVSSNKQHFKRFIHLAKLNLSHLCEQNAHIGNLSWT